MSRIDELIRELAPTGVAYVGIAEVTDYIRGITYNKNDEAADGEVSVLRANNITLASNTLNLTDVKKVSGRVRVRDDQRLRAGDVLICAGSGSKDHIGKVAYIDADRDETFGGFMAVVRVKDSTRLDPRFVFHLLTGENFSTYLGSALSTTTINNLNAGVMRGYRIPVPPLEVQREIVRVLDQFTQLEAELEAELEARRRQYEHYRRTALTFDSSVPRVALGDLVRVKTGSPVSKQAIARNPGIYPVINSGREPLGFMGDFNTEGDPIGVTSRGAGVGSITWCEGRYFRGNLNYGVTIKDASQVDVRFLYHSLQYMQPQIQALCSFQGIPALNKANLEKLILPVPSSHEQARIANLLDTFDTLVSDLSIGLPAELNARRKQYEYYRDKLLTFEEAAA